MGGIGWHGATIESLPGLAARAPLTLCGSGACIDARISLHDIGPMLDAAAPEAAEFARMLQSLAARGQGGELASNGTEGPKWIARNLPVSYAMGGTGPHAATTISAAGAPALLALADRSARMLSLAHPDILLAEGDGVIRAAEATCCGAGRPPVHIFEYTAGEAVGAVVPTRTSRIIVRFSNFLLEDDADFARASLTRINEAGAGLVSGFNSVPAADMRREAARVAALARAWRAGGLATVHLELAGYDSIDLLHAAIGELQHAITSLGMSHSDCA
jgi:ADP-dependent phosphofructokinase/glucokinase